MERRVPNDHRQAGRWGEQVAGAYLIQQGYTLLERNYSCRFGEIDIVAENRGFLVFAEVKLRKNARFGYAREFVTAAKQRRIIMTARRWLMEHTADKQPRFDVIEIYGQDGVVREINHIENAFTL